MAFGQQSGIQVTVDGTLARDLSSPAVRGTMTGQQALTRLLAGSGLTYVIADDATVAIERSERPGGDDTFLLDPLVVEGALREDPRGPVEGYRATRSVTGTRLDVPLDEQPLPIQVLPREVIEDLNATRLEDVVRLSTGGAIVNTFGGTNQEFLVRGFESRVLRDGAPQAFQGFEQTDTANVERVEVLRGPASALYGQGTPGGVVNVVTKRPTDASSAEFASEASSFRRLRQEADINVPLADRWNLNARLVGAAEWADSFRFRDDFDEAFPEDRQLLAPSLSFSPTPTTDVVISGEALWSSDVFDTGVPVLDDARLGADIDDFFGDEDVGTLDSRTLSGRAEVTQQITDGLSLRLFGSAIRNDVEGLSLDALILAQTDLDAAAAQALLGLPQAVIADETIFRALRQRDFTSESYTIQSDLNGSFTTGPLDHDVLVSVEYQGLSRDFVFRATNLFANPDLVSRFDPGAPTVLTRDDLQLTADTTIEVESYGLMLYNQVSAFDRIHLLLGGRTDFLDQRFKNRRTSSVQDIQETEFSPRVGVVVEPFADVPFSVFASYGESFEPTTNLGADGSAFAPQTGRVIEGGLRYGFNDDRLAATLTVFDIELENVPFGTDSFFFVPATQESRGVELELQGAVTDNLSIVASYVYTDAELTEVGAGGSQLAVGDAPQGVPEHSVNLLARYSFDRGALDGLSLTGSLQYASRRINSSPTELRAGSLPPVLFDRTELASFVRVDIGAAYALTENVRIEAGVQNLFDQEIANARGSSFAVPEPPLTAFGSLRIRF
ncbi:TonB-dependent siderophore receptor [Algihabitans sp.]|uniref:TonB-dependent siderophore receptor n=1 Tax=Algihabitans sp. TaxID=2821514 RepID=UPI003BA99318